jgi:hypothetical protein
VIVERVHGIQRHGSAIEILHVEIGDVVTLGEKGEIGLGFVAEEFGAPDPGTARGGRGGDDEESVAAGDLKIDPSGALPDGGFVRGAEGGGGGEEKGNGEGAAKERVHEMKIDMAMERKGNETTGISTEVTRNVLLRTAGSAK